jgi:Rho termination factor, N-terminal domain
MFDLINPIDTALRPIEGLYCFGQLALPHLKAVWQVVTAEKTRRILRAIGMAVLVMATIVLCGMLELGRLAVREATIAFRAQLETTVARSNAAETTEGRQLGEEALISRQTGVRQLRQVATERGIRNAGRMRKPELLAVLELG